MCGVALVLSGIVLLMLLKHIPEHLFLTKTILVVGAFLALNGVLSVIYMFNNPFAWLALILNLSMFAIAILLRFIKS